MHSAPAPCRTALASHLRKLGLGQVPTPTVGARSRAQMRSCRRERKTGVRLGAPDALAQCVPTSSGASTTVATGRSTSLESAIRSGASAEMRVGILTELAGAEPVRMSQQARDASTASEERVAPSGQQQLARRSRRIRQKKAAPPEPGQPQPRAPAPEWGRGTSALCGVIGVWGLDRDRHLVNQLPRWEFCALGGLP